MTEYRNVPDVDLAGLTEEDWLGYPAPAPLTEWEQEQMADHFARQAEIYDQMQAAGKLAF